MAEAGSIPLRAICAGAAARYQCTPRNSELQDLFLRGILLAKTPPSVLLIRNYGDESMSHLGDRIRNRRSKLGWTQEHLAEKAQISKGFVSDLETGARGVGADNLLEISQALGVTLDYLMKGDESEPENAQVHVPSSLSDFAKQEGLSFAQTLMLLDMRRQIKAHRSSSHSDDLEQFDWRQFYEAVKQFLK